MVIIGKFHNVMQKVLSVSKGWLLVRDSGLLGFTEDTEELTHLLSALFIIIYEQLMLVN